MENINITLDENTNIIKANENILNLITPISKNQLKKMKKRENWEKFKKEKRIKEKVNNIKIR